LDGHVFLEDADGYAKVMSKVAGEIVKGGVKRDHWGGEKVDHFLGEFGLWFEGFAGAAGA
jgi:hypothetical protein